MDFKPENIEKLAKIINENGLTEISLEDGEQAITIRKDLVPEVVGTQAVVASTPASHGTVTDRAVPHESANAVEPEEKGKAITSPMVGTFYSASAPDAPSFVEVGSEVAVGDVVCIIEAMKLMNEIKSEQAGKVVKICVKNGDPVEFGQVLMYVE